MSNCDFQRDLLDLPPVNSSCLVKPAVPLSVVRVNEVQLPDEHREISTFDNEIETFVREDNQHTTFKKNVFTNVNRNHLHTQRIITNENQFNHYVTNHVVKPKDIHIIRVEHYPGKKSVFNDYKETRTVEPAQCVNC